LENIKPLVSIIILNYNSGNWLSDCVDSILKTNYKNYEIIVIDNLSIDNSHKICKERFNQINLVENDENLGYCEGNNVGIRKAKGDFLVILNPDTLVETTWLDELIIAFSKYGEGIYQPKILASTDHDLILSTGNMVQLFGFGFSRGKGEKNTNQFENDQEISYASGTCLFTSSKIMKSLSGFDSFLFAYHDDLDLCWRASLAGIKSFYIHNSIIYHPIEGYSFKWSPFKFYLMERNRLYCIFTHYSRKTILKMLPSLILVDLAVTGFYVKKGLLLVKIKTHLNILKNFGKICKKYSEIQKTRKISDKEIIKNFLDIIDVPPWVMKQNQNKFFNKFLKKLSNFSRNLI
jgi:GT2 family glycosyltransferase